MTGQTPAELLAEENNGTEILVRESDGAVFVKREVALSAISKLQWKLSEAEKALHHCGQALRGSYEARG